MIAVWIKFHNSVFCTLHQIILDDNMQEDEMGEVLVPVENMINSYIILDGNPEGKRLLEQLCVNCRKY